MRKNPLELELELELELIQFISVQFSWELKGQNASEC